MYPTSSEQQAALGRLAANLLADPSWMLRRKEKVTLLDESIVRREMSVDFALPEDQQQQLEWMGQPVWYAPLFFLQKGADDPFVPSAQLSAPEPHFANFDFRDQRGRSLSLSSRTWNAAITGYMLGAIIEDALADRPELHDPDLLPGLAEAAITICTVDQLSAVALLHGLRAGRSVDNAGQLTAEESLLRDMDARSARLRTMLDVCAISAVMMVPLVGNEPRAGIFKLSYDELVAHVDSKGRRGRRVQAGLGWTGYELWVDSPFIGASTYHFEIQAPEGLEIYDAGLVEVELRALHEKSTRDYSPALDRMSGYTARLHLYAPTAKARGKAFAWVRLRVRRQEFVSGAMFATILVAVTLWSAWLLADQAADSPASVPTLLLLFPSVIAAYVARPGPHPLTVRMLRWARWVVVGSALLPFSAAGLLALAERNTAGKVAHPHFAGPWLALALTATALAAIVLVGRLVPVPERLRQERLRSLQQTDHPEPWIHRWRDGRLGAVLRWWRATELAKRRDVARRRQPR